MSDQEKAINALAVMVQAFANRPGLFGQLMTKTARKDGWTPAIVKEMLDAAGYAKTVLADLTTA